MKEITNTTENSNNLVLQFKVISLRIPSICVTKQNENINTAKRGSSYISLYLSGSISICHVIAFQIYLFSICINEKCFQVKYKMYLDKMKLIEEGFTKQEEKT